MTGQQLKNSILQLAIQGKLVPQDPNDEPASELLKRIRKEKEQLVKDGKLKKKDLEVTPIAEDEKPFEIPESWEWVRLNWLSSKITDGTHKTPKYTETGIKFVSAKNLAKGSLSFNGCKFISISEHTELYKRCNPEFNDLLISKSGSIGSVVLNPFVEEFSMFESLALVKYNKDLINSKTLLYFVQFACIGLSGEEIKGVAIKHFPIESIKTLLIPLPPLAEQKRIVAKIEELLPLVEEYGNAQEELNKLNATLPDKLRQGILQEAIMGKLVPQDPNDEPASKLLERIQEEKKRLVKEGKLKKKDLEVTPITDEEKPFDLLKGWEWVRLGNICYLLDGIKKEGKQALLDAKYLRGKTTEEYLDKGKYVTEGSKIILVDGENSGEVFTAPINGYMGSTFKELYIVSSVNTEYFNYILLNYKTLFRNSKKGAAIPHLNKELFRNLPIGLPPLAEQHRIVAKLEELLPKLNELK